MEVHLILKIFKNPKLNVVTKSKNCPTLKAGELVSGIINPKPGARQRYHKP
jgi:hypothetical protein